MIVHPLKTRASRLQLPSMGGLTGDRVAGALSRRLDDGYHYFRHVSLAGGARAEGIVVGPGGTWCLSRAELHDRFRKRNGHWYRWNRSTESWVPWEPVPITATRLAARRLALYLERAALPSEVTPILLPPADTTVDAAPGEQLGVIVAREPDRIASTAVAQERLSQPQVDRIVALLDPRQPLPRLAPSTPSG